MRSPFVLGAERDLLFGDPTLQMYYSGR